MISVITGFGMCGGLIVAIGAQNAFVLSQGIRRRYPLFIALVCIICDAFLIGIGVAGMGSLVAASRILMQIATWTGVGFLSIYGILSFRSAIRGGALTTETDALSTRKEILFATLAVTFLNPHTYLDTVVLMGSVSATFIGIERLLFWIGAVSASAVWFLMLSVGGRLLAPFFKKQSAWRILDVFVGLTMWVLAFSMAMKGMSL